MYEILQLQWIKMLIEYNLDKVKKKKEVLSLQTPGNIKGVV